MKKVIILIVVACALIFQGCSSKSSEDADSDGEDVTITATEGATASPVATVTISPTATIAPTAITAPTEKPKDLVLPVVGNDTGKVLIQTVSASTTYRYNSYIITSVNGESIVVDPTLMPNTKIIDLNPAAILETHAHPDHTDIVFDTANKEAQTLKYEEGKIKTNDFNIYSILSSHDSDTISTSNVIMVMEVDGLRIAHMGDIGQTKLTEDQLKALGEIDIAFMQFENSYSGMSLENEKGFNLIEQLNPKIIIPTHYSAAAETVLEEKYGAISEFDNILEITKDELPEGNLHVYKILNTHKYY